MEPFIGLASQWMNMQDPPRHTCMRALLKKGFTPRAAKRLRPRIQATVDELLAGVDDRCRNLQFRGLRSLPVRLC